MQIIPRVARKAALTSRGSVMKPEELARLVGYSSIRAYGLCREYAEHEILSRRSAGEPITLHSVAWIAMCLYEAGRIDGKREERARRRAQKPTTARPR